MTSLIFGWLLAEFGIGLAPWAIFLLLSLFLISVLSVLEGWELSHRLSMVVVVWTVFNQ